MGGVVRRFRVTVDDPGMASAHTYVIEAGSQPAAVVQATRRAILEDERGCGLEPEELDAALRMEWADSWEIVRMVGGYAQVQELTDSAVTP